MFLNAVANDPRNNHLLAALWPTEQSWLSLLQAVDLPAGMMLFEAGQELHNLYFPTTAVISLMMVLENGDTAETAMVGNEGIVGVSTFMGGESALTCAAVRIAGRGWRIRTEVLLQEFHRCGLVQQLLLRYTQALIAQMSQTAICNRHHVIDQQLCRSLLLTLDRLQGNEVVMTHDQIAQSLGVRREGVTAAAGALQKAGFIRSSRGRMTVLGRAGLEARVCECYGVVRARYDELNIDVHPEVCSKSAATRALAADAELD